MHCTKKFIVVNSKTNKIVYSTDDLDAAVDKANFYRHGGDVHNVFTNTMIVDHQILPDLKLFGA